MFRKTLRKELMCTWCFDICLWFYEESGSTKNKRGTGEHNNMTQGNDHQQILWHGNKRKKYARIVLEQTSRMRKYKWGIFQIPSYVFLARFTLFFLFITISIMMKIKKRENAYIIIIMKWSQTASMLLTC